MCGEEGTLAFVFGDMWAGMCCELMAVACVATVELSNVEERVRQQRLQGGGWLADIAQTWTCAFVRSCENITCGVGSKVMRSQAGACAYCSLCTAPRGCGCRPNEPI